MATTPYTFRMDDELRQALEHEAKLEGRPAAQLAATAIKAMVDARVKKRRAIEAAFAEADKGVFVSEEAVDRWMDSWGTDNELPPPEPDIFPDR